MVPNTELVPIGIVQCGDAVVVDNHGRQIALVVQENSIHTREQSDGNFVQFHRLKFDPAANGEPAQVEAAAETMVHRVVR